MAFRFSNPPPSTDAVAYAVKPGDTLSGIIHHYYGSIPHTQRQDIIRSIQAANPAITNPNYIRPGQLIKLEVPVQHCRIPQFYSPLLYGYGQEDWFTPMERNWATASAEERHLQMGLAKLMLSTGSASLAGIDRTFKNSVPLLEEMLKNYEDYKLDAKTKGQYDYQRRKILQVLSNRLGPTNFLLNGRQPPNEVLRISRAAGTVPTQPISQQIRKMQQVSKIASRGGVALSVVGLGVACYEISQTDDVARKNEILVESIGSLFGGAIFGLGAGFAVTLMLTPVGWVGALVIGAGSIISGYGMSQAFRGLYDATGRRIDFVGKTGVSTLCARGGVERLKDPSPKISSAALSFL